MALQRGPRLLRLELRLQGFLREGAQRYDGGSADGDHADRDRADGDRTDGNRTHGDRTHGDRNYGDLADRDHACLHPTDTNRATVHDTDSAADDADSAADVANSADDGSYVTDNAKAVSDEEALLEHGCGREGHAVPSHSFRGACAACAACADLSATEHGGMGTDGLQ